MIGWGARSNQPAIIPRPIRRRSTGLFFFEPVAKHKAKAIFTAKTPRSPRKTNNNQELKNYISYIFAVFGGLGVLAVKWVLLETPNAFSTTPGFG
jgi:hypothetical protein